MLAQASSTKSIALSGRNLSVIYLLLNMLALTIALSVILTPWCASKRSFKPLNILIVSSTVGSSTKIFEIYVLELGLFQYTFYIHLK